jgi:hypothetical protein
MCHSQVAPYEWRFVIYVLLDIGTLQRMAHIHQTLLQTVMILNGIMVSLKFFLRVVAHIDIILLLLESQQLHKFCSCSLLIQILSLTVLAWCTSDSHLIKQAVSCNVSVFMNKFLDSCHIFIWFASGRASWMLNIVNWCHCTLDPGKPKRCFCSAIISSIEASFNILWIYVALLFSLKQKLMHIWNLWSADKTNFRCHDSWDHFRMCYFWMMRVKTLKRMTTQHVVP